MELNNLIKYMCEIRANNLNELIDLNMDQEGINLKILYDIEDIRRVCRREDIFEYPYIYHYVAYLNIE